MRRNHVKHGLAAGGTAVGTLVMEFATSGIARIAAAAGAQFVLYDMEHTGWSLDTVRGLMATSRAADIVPLVRVPANSRHLISGALDVGALGIAVPQVESAEEAQAIVTAAKFPPLGKRGVSAGAAHDDYVAGNVAEMIEHANRETMLVAMIETVRAVEHCDAIAATSGIDAIWIGQFDLTTSLGIPGQFEHPDYLAARTRILATCRKHNKAALFGAGNPADLLKAADDGFRMLMLTSDITLYQQALRSGLSQLQK